MQKQIRFKNLPLLISCFECVSLDFPDVTISERYEVDGEIFLTVNFDSKHFNEEKYQAERKKGI